MIKLNLDRWLQKQWQHLGFWTFLLAPFSLLFYLIVILRKFLYKIGVFSSIKLPVPVIVVGNITVGGTGKTPLVIWLVEALCKHGFKPGVISRGFGANVKTEQEVQLESSASDVGDEPLLIKHRLRCPVFVGKNRVNAGALLLKRYSDCDIIISDDGLQHEALKRDVEIAVIEGGRGLGNLFLLPAGPLRESANRLDEVDAVVINGKLSSTLALKNVMQMQFTGEILVNIHSQKNMLVKDLVGKKIHAVAGIGNPDRFFDTLKKFGLSFDQTEFVDHHKYVVSDFDNIQADYVLMTEKDAVKCTKFANENWWYLPISAYIDQGLIDLILKKMQKI